VCSVRCWKMIGAEGVGKDLANLGVGVGGGG
jgi:hypothetical protein